MKNKFKIIDKAFENLNNNEEMALSLLEIVDSGNCLDEIKNSLKRCLGFNLEVHEIYKINDGNHMFVSMESIVFEMSFCESRGWVYKILSGFANYKNSFSGEYKNRVPTMADLVDSQNF